MLIDIGESNTQAARSMTGITFIFIYFARAFRLAYGQ